MISVHRTGAYLSQLRREANLTQADLAGQLSVSPQAVSKWETGLALPDPEQLLALSHLFGVSINAILLGDSRSDVVVEDAPAVPELEPEPVAGEHAEPETAAKQALDLETIVRLAPLLDEETLREMIEQVDVAAFSLKQITRLAPHLDSETLSQIAERLSRVDLDHLEALAPFLRSTALERLLGNLDQALTTDEIIRFAPFVSGERLGALFLQRADRDGEAASFERLVALAPFLPTHALSDAIAARPPRTYRELERIAPFLETDTLKQVARRLVAAGG